MVTLANGRCKYRKDIEETEDLYVSEINHLMKDHKGDTKKLVADHETEYLAHKAQIEAQERRHEADMAKAKQENLQQTTDLRILQEAETSRLREDHLQQVMQIQHDPQSESKRVRDEPTMETKDLEHAHQVDMSRAETTYSLQGRELHKTIEVRLRALEDMEEDMAFFREIWSMMSNHEWRSDCCKGNSIRMHASPLTHGLQVLNLKTALQAKDPEVNLPPSPFFLKPVCHLCYQQGHSAAQCTAKTYQCPSCGYALPLGCFPLVSSCVTNIV